MRADPRGMRVLLTLPFALSMPVLAGSLLMMRPAGAVEATQVHIDDATIGGRSLMQATSSNPVRLPTTRGVPLGITLTNTTDAPINVRAVQMVLSMLGVRLASYQASVEEIVPPHGTVTIYQAADFFTLDKAATGYVNAKVQVVDEARTTVASQPFSASVNGKINSDEGVFFLALVALTLIGVIEILLRMARGQLSRNRFLRGLGFGFTALCGAGSVVVGVAIVEVALLEPKVWIPTLLVATAAGFVVGYISPSYTEPDIGARTETRVIDIVATEAVARASGNYARRTTGGTTAPHVDIRESNPHNSGGYAAPHDSGGYAPQHDSEPFTPADPSAG